MPVPYSERKKRRQRLAQELPPDLRGCIALRHVEAVSKFAPQTQRTLAEALERGVRVPAAIAFLKEHPEALTNDVVLNCNNQKRTPRPELAMETGKPQHDKVASRTLWRSLEPGFEEALNELTELLEFCYPDMPRITAEAMAGSGLMAGVLAIIQALQTCFEAPQAHSDFVLVVLCGLAHKTIERLDQIVSQKPIYRQALQQSGVTWPGANGAGRAGNI